LSPKRGLRNDRSTCRYNDSPGFVRNGAALEPCQDCGGTMVALATWPDAGGPLDLRPPKEDGGPSISSDEVVE